MLSSFLSAISPFKSKSTQNSSKKAPFLPPQETLEHAISELQGTLLQNFTLFHHTTARPIDLLIFLPHYGLYLGEHLNWKKSDLKGATVEQSTQNSTKEPTTQLESTQKLLHQKLEDVLSFDSTPIERFFWLENLTEEEFDLLDSSFHKLLPKRRLLFADDTTQNIQDKLVALGTYHDHPYSKLKVVGSLQAHTLLLPTTAEPFGAFLNTTQTDFLEAIPPKGSPLILGGVYASGKSTVLLRKIAQVLLENPNATLMVITPTRLNGEILRQNLVALGEFASVTFDFTRIHFVYPNTLYGAIDPNEVPINLTHIICDDMQLLDITDFIHKTIQSKGVVAILSGSILTENTTPYILKHPYRTPEIRTEPPLDTTKTIYILILRLRDHLATLASTPIIIIVPNTIVLKEYKDAIDEYFHLESKILDDAFSLQYKNLDSITLSTPEFISAVSVSHVYLINLDPTDDLYPLALSRASKSVTIISEEN
jgi:hypothetical protein